MRLINADALEKKLHELALDEWNHGPSTSWSNAYLECEDIVYNAPTVDAVPVVRCKNCKYYEETGSGGIGTCLLTISGAEVDGFCAWGERREDGKAD